MRAAGAVMGGWWMKLRRAEGGGQEGGERRGKSQVAARAGFCKEMECRQNSLHRLPF